jgi:hypothetical protein
MEEVGNALKSWFCLTTMNPQAGLGRVQEGGLNCCRLWLDQLFGSGTDSGRGSFLLSLRSQGVGPRSLASEMC